MKQKILVKVQMHCDNCRTKALKIAAGAHGVSKVSLQGEDHLEVIGDGVDSVCLTSLLRKKLKFAIIVKVEEVKEEKVVEKPKETVIKCTPSACCVQYCPPRCPPICYEVVRECPEPSCSIM